MFKRLFVLLAAYLFLLTLSSKGQDVLYQKDGETLKGKVSLIAEEWISFKGLNHRTTSPQQVNKTDVLMLFYEDGDYLLFHNSLPGGYYRVPFDNEYYDKLISKTGAVIPVEESTVFSTEIHYRHLLDNKEKKKIGKEEIVAILYRNKSHQLLAPVQDVARVLAMIHKLPVPDIQSNNANETPGEENIIAVSNNNENSSIPGNASHLPVDEEAFKRKATERTEELTYYIQLISDKQTSPFEANKGIEQAIKLFVSDTSIVEVSSKNTENLKRFSIRDYLQHIKLLKYDKVEVTWVEVNYVGDIRKGTDGNYYGYVTFVQIFRGFKDGKVMYEDMTEKRVEVMLKGYTKFEEGKALELWDVLLSNIKVEETI